MSTFASWIKYDYMALKKYNVLDTFAGAGGLILKVWKEDT